MADDPRWPYARIPHFAYPENCPGMTSSRFMTYCAVRSFCYFRTVANQGFNRCTASLATIAKRAGQSRATVVRNLKWLEGHFLIYRTPAGWNRPKVITPVNFPNAFYQACMDVGREQAVIEEEDELEEMRSEKWKQNAKEAGERREDAGGDGRGRHEKCRLTDEPGSITGETGDTSHMSLGGIIGDSLRTGFKHRFEAKVVEARASSDTPPMTLDIEIRASQDQDSNSKPFAEREPKSIPTPEEIREKVRDLGPANEKRGREIFTPMEFDEDEYKRIKAEVAARDRARRTETGK